MKPTFQIRPLTKKQWANFLRTVARLTGLCYAGAELGCALSTSRPRQALDSMKTFIALIATCVLLTGCAASHPGLNHFAKVEKNLYRCAQPDADAWRTMADLFDNNYTIIKLSPGPETIPDGVIAPCVFYFPISTWDQLFGRPDMQLEAALCRICETLRDGGVVVVHCEHGDDRTGILIGLYRLLQGWSKADAYAEMIRMGYHPELYALTRYWKYQ